MKTLFSTILTTSYLVSVAANCLCAQPVPAHPATTAKFRVLSYMNLYSQPIGVTEASAGIFYTQASSSYSLVFTINSEGKLNSIASFQPGVFIDSLFVVGANGRVYNSVSPGNNMFSVAGFPGKTSYPAQSVVPFLTQSLPGGRLLGTGASQSGQYDLVTTDETGVVVPIYESTDRLLLHTALLASDGNYYGIAALQDASGYVYRVTSAGSMTKIWSFAAGTFNGPPPWVPLLQGSDGSLYGVTPYGGANGTGTIYKLTLGGQYTLLYEFPKGANYNPSALIEASDGNLYGATTGFAGQSLLFRISKSGQYTLLRALVPYYEGQCQCQLTQGSDGTIYGSAQAGGITGAGLYFALDASLPKPSPRAQHFQPQSGAVGTQVLVWGSNLLAATVSFNGLAAASVTNSGPNYVWATVPAGAATGPVTVTTPGGTFTTIADFTVQ